MKFEMDETREDYDDIVVIHWTVDHEIQYWSYHFESDRVGH